MRQSSTIHRCIMAPYSLPLLIVLSLVGYGLFGAPVNVPLLKLILPYYLIEGMILSSILALLKIPRWVTLLALASTFTQVVFLFNANIADSAPDFQGHKEYVLYLLEHSFMPPAPVGFQPTQPPLYYMWCALWFKFGQWLGVDDPWHVVRLSSRGLYLGYVLLCILLIERLHLPLLSKISAISITLFWPTAHLLSVRFNNDIGFMFTFMATIVALQRWREELSYKHLGIALISAGLSVLCKATGFMSVVAVAGAIAQDLANRRITYRYFLNRSFIYPAVGMALCLASYFGRIILHRLTTGDDLLWFANVHAGQEQHGPLSLYLLTHIDLVDFVMNPGISWDVMWANQYTFWGYLFRTMLYSQGYLQALAPSSLINALWIGVLGIALWQARPREGRGSDSRHADLLLIATLAMLVLYIVQRLIVPDINLGYGRRIQPLVAIIASLAALTLKEQHRAGLKALYILHSLLCIGFAAASFWLTANTVLAGYLPIF